MQPPYMEITSLHGRIFAKSLTIGQYALLLDVTACTIATRPGVGIPFLSRKLLAQLESEHAVKSL